MNDSKHMHRHIIIAPLLGLLLSLNLGFARAPAPPFVLAYDVYLGFPTQDPQWQDFFKRYHIQLKPYRNIDTLVTDLKNHQITAAFLPAGGYYYLRADPHYQGIASASLGKDKHTLETAYLLVKQTSALQSIAQLRHARLGYINHACTTSFFGTKIYLSQHHLPFPAFFEKLVPVDGFEGQVTAIQHSSDIDATMLWDVYWYKHPKLRQQTRIIGKISGLPSAVVIFNTHQYPQIKQAFIKQLLAYHPKHAPWQYSGFVPFQNQENLQFWRQGGLT